MGTKWNFVGNGDMVYLRRAKELKKEADVLANKKEYQATKYARAAIVFIPSSKYMDDSAVQQPKYYMDIIALTQWVASMCKHLHQFEWNFKLEILCKMYLPIISRKVYSTRHHEIRDS